jgi:hypothetical protein
MKNLICLITFQIFYEPVVIYSGITFEKDTILQHFKTKLICPVTN